jgi:hypothetical protein
MAKKTASPADALLDRLRTACFGFPGTEEKLSHGMPSFHVRGKHFAAFVDDHHGSGLVGAWCKSTIDEQRRLVALDPERYFVPPYVGVKGWVGVRLDHPNMDWIELAIIVEGGWASIVPKSVANGPVRPPPRIPPRPTTDPDVARAALARLSEICAALPESTCERESRHATFRVRKKVYAYFLDNHHGDGNIAACVKVSKPSNKALAAKDPKRFFVPAYIGARGYVGMRLDKRVDWTDVAERVTASWRSVAPKRLLEKERATAGG